jgi:predicted nucleotidyltransferase
MSQSKNKQNVSKEQSLHKQNVSLKQCKQKQDVSMEQSERRQDVSMEQNEHRQDVSMERSKHKQKASIDKNENFGLPKNYLEKICKIFKKYEKIEKAILYGSRALGTYKQGSDIDITIIAPKMSFSEYVDLISKLDEAKIPNKIDLTKYDLIDDKIKDHIQRVGIIIYKKES